MLPSIIFRKFGLLMKKLSYPLNTLILVLVFFATSSIYSQTVNPDYLDGRLWVKFKNNYHYEHLTDRKGKVDIKKIPLAPQWVLKYQITEFNQSFHFMEHQDLTQVYEIVFSNIHMIDDLLIELKKLNSVDYAEPKPYVTTSYIPNDPYYSPTGMAKYGGPFNWKWPLDQINAEGAWQYTTGDPNIKVAIVDDGVWTSHPDLTNKVVSQYHAVSQSNDCNPPTNVANWEKKFPHGTHVAGLAAAETNNGTGIASIGYDVSIIGVRISNDNAYLTHAYEGVSWASTNGANVINMSWGGGGFSQTAQTIMDNAHANGILLVAAAGNNNSSSAHYPSALNHVISVASTDQDNGKSNFSNYGTTVDLAAPGGNANDLLVWSILSTVPYPHPVDSVSEVYGNYDNFRGTSMASPIVSGLCGLLLSYDLSLTSADVDTCLRTTANNIDAQNPTYINKLGHGRINAGSAMACIADKANKPIPDFLAYPTQAYTNDPVGFYDYTLGFPTSWSWQFPGGTPSTSNLELPSVSYSQIGTYDVTLTSTNASGSNTHTKSNYITILSNSKPTANFAANPPNIQMGDYTDFIDQSSLATSWEWYFSGGSPSSSTDQNPQYIDYQNTGAYDVTLIVHNQYGSDTLTKTNYIIVNAPLPPVADFYGLTQNVNAGSVNGYWDLTTNNPALYIWSFPGGNPSSSNDFSPMGISYNTPGIYDVGLIACNSAGCDTIVKQAYISVHSGSAQTKPSVDFSISNSYITHGDSIQITPINLTPSVSITNSYYEFQGGNPPNAMNYPPSDIGYFTPGNFYIKYIACNAAGCDTVLKYNAVHVIGPGNSLTACDTLLHFNGASWDVNSNDSAFFISINEYDESYLPPRFLEEIELKLIPNNWWALTDLEPDIYFELFDDNNNLIHKSSVIQDQQPPVSWPISHLLYDMNYKVHFWDKDLLIDDDLGELTFDPHSQTVFVSNGSTSMYWEYTQHGISTYWKTLSETNSSGTNYYNNITSNFNPPGQASDWIIFGPITIPASGAKLYWEHRYPNNDYRGAYEILASKSGNTLNDFQFAGYTLKSIADNDNETLWDTDWTPMEVDLDPSTYGNQQVYFAVHHKGNDQYLFHIDDILLKDCSGPPVNIKEPVTANVTIYPNPFIDKTSIEFTSGNSITFQLEIFDISGKLVLQKEPNTNSKFLLNKGKLNAGLYILKVSDGTSTFHQKLVIK
ncbi:MAG TPA: T9SS type A sorting domain-containing protein [Bacteroidetes bacterium]|nr:T9SS type A sorting domain-containing protein [Bacteroidota bacterium]